MKRVLPLLAAALPMAACAGTLPDPTRPPSALLSAPVAASAPQGAPRLQSVLLGNGRTPAAVINGELVLLGGRVGESRLVRLTERSAVLRGPQGDTTLALIPTSPSEPKP
jgi:MSHA biogenesis protein MshK